MSRKNNMKTNLKLLTLFAVVMLLVAGCGGQKQATQETTTKEATSQKEVTLKVATLIPPMTDVLDIVKPLLKQDGVNLEIVVLSDNIQPNNALASREVDANFFQHAPFMQQYNESNKSDLVAVKPIYNAIYGAYSKKYKNVKDLPEGATIAIANDPANTGRSLVMMEQNGLIKLKEGVGYNATQADIIENKKKFVFKEVDLLMLARSLDDVDMAAMYPAYAKPLGLTPKKDALITEKDDTHFAINLVARKDNADSDAIQKLAKRMTGPEVRKFFEDNYKDSVVPAF
ncbi:MetQ/NlpA family ABC transporter substrate-binding protein [Paenibacillus polymyxa]|uniref:MetQ/NlpA family ABC transporter substrate-binding protein n=1 Tax=Paenibacillus polymyxa TaxID=1406 RepID=UPI0005ED40F4|nr:MetQ/NlpA family ABC transporter substrate-binding protein [Paenibacillus polymyxa]KJK31643.1 ABC transporter substrate-binding protein [Paenibacillus polymyxa]MDN4076427.1 MetQ/NlpA family ABC transporter substrate-binding protein [Paenibacillus polymyxa]MDN4084278.1 MetQ/NlpA family ABC transporter substrate-binding protein [Paenibacillus polymyxa]MDN4086379.1 MetQ/NlpA family ABC transporter substrate-binding protein [Paenibacillus polymyxa]MDN4101853.1 MetQ/NlpA family ABC transporter s